MIVKIALESNPNTRWIALLLASENDEQVDDKKEEPQTP
jgi:hypothetical protein